MENWEKMIDLTSKLGEINDKEHNNGSKIYPQNQVILDCIMSTILLKHKCLSIILIWVIVCHKEKWSLKKMKKNIYFFTFLNLEKQTWYWEKRWLFSIGNGAETRLLEDRKCPVVRNIRFFEFNFGHNGFRARKRKISLRRFLYTPKTYV